MAKYVAVSPDTGNEYEVTSREELVNLLSRGYTEKSTKGPAQTKQAAGTRQSADETAAGGPMGVHTPPRDPRSA